MKDSVCVPNDVTKGSGFECLWGPTLPAAQQKTTRCDPLVFQTALSGSVPIGVGPFAMCTRTYTFTDSTAYFDLDPSDHILTLRIPMKEKN